MEKPKRLAQLDNQLCGEKHIEFFVRTWNGMYVVVGHFIIFSRIYTYNWLRDHTSWVQVELKWRLKVFSRTSDLWFWNSPYRGTLLFLNSKTYLVHVINYEWSSEWSRSVNFPLHMFYMRYKLCFSNSIQHASTCSYSGEPNPTKASNILMRVAYTGKPMSLANMDWNNHTMMIMHIM